MKIERVIVKVLRSRRNEFANDGTELEVAIEDGEDWTKLEPILRRQCVDLINTHWSETIREQNEAIAAEREAHFKAREAERNQWLSEEWESNTGRSPCVECRFDDTCSTCDHTDEEADIQPF